MGAFEGGIMAFGDGDLDNNNFSMTFFLGGGYVGSTNGDFLFYVVLMIKTLVGLFL